MELAAGFQLDEWQVLPPEGRIVRVDGTETRHVRRKAMDVLCALAAQQGRVCARDDLLDAVWGRRAVSDEPLTSTIGELRRLLGEGPGNERRYIETIPKRGYRLLPEITSLKTAADELGVVANQSGAGTDAAEPVQPVRRAPQISLDLRGVMLLLLAVVVVGIAVYLAGDESPPAETEVPEHSIAVLRFETLTAQSATEYFSEGLASELIAMLTRVPTLHVAARNSSFALQDEGLPFDTIGARLNVAYLLTGTVQRMGDELRVTAQLVDARSGYQRWSATYDRTIADVFAIQDDIASEVRAALRVELFGSPISAQPTDAQAYTLYLQARHVGRQHSESSLQRAAQLYEASLEIDSAYLPAWDGLAGVYLNQVGLALLAPQEGFRRASEAAYRALAIDADHAPAHGRLGWIALHANSNLSAAAEHYRRALLAEPGNDVIRSDAAPVALALGRMEDAIALFEASAASDPVSPASHANLANAYQLARRFAEAEQSIRNALTLSPDYAAAQYRLGRALLAQDDLPAAAQAFAAESFDAARWVGEALLANRLGQLDQSDAALAQLEQRYGNAAAGNLAQVYAHRGAHDQAFDWLEREFATSGAGAFVEYRWDPLFDPLREDPRWQALMTRVGLDDDSLAAIDFPTLADLGNALTTPSQ